MLYKELIKKAKQHKSILTQGKKLKIAVTGMGSLQFISDALHASLTLANIDSEIYTSPYNSWHKELLETDSPLHHYGPDALVFITDSKSVWMSSPDYRISTVAIPDLNEIIERGLRTFAQKSDVYVVNAYANSNTGFGVIEKQNNFPLYDRVVKYNENLDRLIDFGCRVIDMPRLVERYGFENAFDLRYWLSVKIPFSIDFSVAVAREVSTKIAAKHQCEKKLIILDCDNTLWGGVIGNDGETGILIGPDSKLGEAFQEFQRFIISAKEVGFLIGICSKNYEEDVKNVFSNHKNMVLRHRDIVDFKVNWERKSQNIVAMTEQLNLGLDSVIFIDDNDVELNEVATNLPMVDCIKAESDPLLTIDNLLSSQLLRRQFYSETDASRTDLYKQNNERLQLRSALGSHEEYLETLEIITEVEVVSNKDFERCLQLLNKTNQFNINGNRLDKTEYQKYTNDSQKVTFRARVQDRFSDHGIVAVINLSKRNNENYLIDAFVLSCRVFNMGIESEILEHVSNYARERGAKQLLLQVRKTEKNRYCMEFLKNHPDLEEDDSGSFSRFL